MDFLNLASLFPGSTRGNRPSAPVSHILPPCPAQLSIFKCQEQDSRRCTFCSVVSLVQLFDKSTYAIDQSRNLSIQEPPSPGGLIYWTFWLITIVQIWWQMMKGIHTFASLSPCHQSHLLLFRLNWTVCLLWLSSTLTIPVPRLICSAL